GKDIDNFLYIDVSEGIALGIIFGGELYRGAGEKAGEFGHTTVDENGPLCSCGNQGCLEVMSSTLALEREAKQFLKQGIRSTLTEKAESGITYHDVLEHALQGDKLALKSIDSVGKYLGISVSNMVNLFNPSLVIMGGIMTQAGDLILEPVRRAIKLRALPALANEVDICLSQLDKYGGSLGAATLVLRKVFIPGA
ncbi:MAG: ROK family protein, partial [Candidatus Omnitrophica bacterium]|nr:ROK family protein [Candidatus Omnitrophota bacterium]